MAKKKWVGFSFLGVFVLLFIGINYFGDKPLTLPDKGKDLKLEADPNVTTKVPKSSLNIVKEEAELTTSRNPSSHSGSNPGTRSYREAFDRILNSHSKSGTWSSEEKEGRVVSSSGGQISLEAVNANILALGQELGREMGLKDEFVVADDKSFAETTLSESRGLLQFQNGLKVYGAQMRFYISKSSNEIYYISNSLRYINPDKIRSQILINFDEALISLQQKFTAGALKDESKDRTPFLWARADDSAEVAYEVIFRVKGRRSQVAIISAIDGRIIKIGPTEKS